MRAFSTPSSFVNIVARLMYKVSGAILRDFSELVRLQNAETSLRKYVLEAERRIEKNLYTGLKQSFPEHNFLMEEMGFISSGVSQAPVWIIDPLDGSSNFSKGIPFFSISVALQEQGELIAGVVYDPIRDEMFWAQKGVGSFLDQYRLRLMHKAPRKYVGLSLPSARHTLEQRRSILRVISQMPSASFRSLGSTALQLAYVAAGRLDGCVEYGSRIWDSAAGLLLVKEAGGRVGHTFLDAVEQKNREATSDIVAAHTEFYDALNKTTTVQI